MAKEWVKVLNEARLENSESTLCFQWCEYRHDNGTIERGYRFIWRKDGKQLPHRGQARIPSIAAAEALIARARYEGWGDHHEDE